jgi:hypothetical protein
MDVLDATTRAAAGDATNQTAQLAALSAPWAGGNVLLDYYDGATRLWTVTHGPWTLDTTTDAARYRNQLGAYVSNGGKQATGTYTHVVARAGSTDYLRWSAAEAPLAGAVPAGIPQVGTARGGSGLYVAANASLPVDGTPAWRAAMTLTNRLYNVSSNKPGEAAGLLPETLPSHYGTNVVSVNTGSGADIMAGYSSGTHLESEGGDYGTMIYGTGGHTRLQNQLLGLDLNDDSPAFFWWRQPEYKTGDTGGANLYYDTGSSVQTVGEDGTSWNREFPVRFDDWVYPRALTTGEMGDGAPHGFRYGFLAYVPASVTGSDPALLVSTVRPQGPFSLAERPSNVTVAEWFNAANLYSPSGRRKWPFHLLNLTSNTWSVVGVMPDVDTTGFQGVCLSTVDVPSKRVYASFDNTNPNTMYLDFSGGLGSVTVSSATPATVTGSHGRGANSIGAFTTGHPTKLLWYWPDLNNAGGLVIQNPGAGTYDAIDLTSKGLTIGIGHEKIGMSYDAENNRILIVQPVNIADISEGIECYSITIPESHLTAADYTVSRVTLSVDAGVEALSNDLYIAEFYGKTRYLPTIGVCLVPFSRGKMLAFRPG